MLPFADVDTRGTTVSATPGGTSTGSNLVYYDFNTAGNGTLTVTWDDVGYYNSKVDKLNAFQLQLVGKGNGNFDVIFRYETINWTTGSASGGTDGLEEPLPVPVTRPATVPPGMNCHNRAMNPPFSGWKPPLVTQG